MEFPDFLQFETGLAPLIFWLRDALHYSGPICSISHVRRNAEFVAAR